MNHNPRRRQESLSNRTTSNTTMAKPQFSQKDANLACRTPYYLLEQRIIQRLVPPDRSGTVDVPLLCFAMKRGRHGRSYS